MVDKANENLLANHDWSFPVPIAYGPGRLGEMGERATNLGLTKPLIVTDQGSAGLPFIDTLQQALLSAGITSEVFAEVAPNPRDSDIVLARAAYWEGGHDSVIAIGGGSGMDAGKSTALTAHNECDIWQFDFDRDVPKLPADHIFPKLICIPTTAGTGAETESTAMVTHSERGMKLCVWHPELKPSLTLLDPEITLGLPASLTAWTGIDAMVHAIEAYCVPDYHPMCDGVALEALALIGRWLPSAVEEPGNLVARGGMQVGACLAGVSFLKGLGLVHAISHMVGADFDTHHGLTNAIVLPAVLKFNSPAISDKLPAMCAALGLQSVDFESFYAAICQLLDRLSVPVTLAEIGVPAEAARTLAEKAHQDAAAGTNPRPADVATIERLILEAITVGR
jgi:alcohol dehydrogenase class IV